MQKTVYLSLGSNVGDRKANLADAIARLTSVGVVTRVSSLYETEPVEFLQQPWFLNCAVELRTEWMPRKLLSGLLNIEREMGRRRGLAKGPRIIDLDIVLFGSTVVDIPQLTIPHPAMLERRFVLEPLAEIAPEVRHPIVKRTIRELREELPKGSPVVRRIESDNWPPAFESAPEAHS